MRRSRLKIFLLYFAPQFSVYTKFGIDPQSLREEFGDKFSQVFKTITVDNGSEFSAFSQVESWGCAVYFAHPYAACFDEVVARAVRVSQPAV